MILVTFHFSYSRVMVPGSPRGNQFLGQRKRPQAGDYGPLGNVLASVLTIANFSRPTAAISAEATKGVHSRIDAAAVPSKIRSMAPQCERTVSTSTRGSSMAAQALKGIRELLKIRSMAP